MYPEHVLVIPTAPYLQKRSKMQINILSGYEVKL